ncbi:BA75_01728T0 [Komagataella pastoris]|uniref:very-long-chain (3R)-3-hydroxyacyl-CoA dehydratase n=1 Tax=Komagataella pastoris TaxID=4922 RepID=A0A1B2J9S1_PICPA|nr:BA75_01728T0 [Komagataella pastoris]
MKAIGVKYLHFFYAMSAILWACVVVRGLLLLPLVGLRFFPGGVADFYLSIAIGNIVIENINHVIFCRKLNYILVLELIGRLFIGLGVILNYPTIAKNAAFPTLVLSQGIIELFRYSYTSYKLKFRIPKSFNYLYLAVILVGYSVKTLSEMVLMFLSLGYADDRFGTFIKIVLLVYIPSAYMFFKHSYARRG